MSECKICGEKKIRLFNGICDPCLVKSSFPNSIPNEIPNPVNRYSIQELWELYKQFCAKYIETQDGKTDCATDFLGWLENYWK